MFGCYSATKAVVTCELEEKKKEDNDHYNSVDDLLVSATSQCASPLYVEERLHMAYIPLNFGPNIMIMKQRSEARGEGQRSPRTPGAVAVPRPPYSPQLGRRARLRGVRSSGTAVRLGPWSGGGRLRRRSLWVGVLAKRRRGCRFIFFGEGNRCRCLSTLDVRIPGLLWLCVTQCRRP